MLETTFTTEIEQGPIPAGFPVHLEGNFIVLIGRNGAGKTSLLNALFRKNAGEKIDGKTQVCLIRSTGKIYTATQPSGQTLEQYNAELAKVLREKDKKDHGATSHIQKLNGFLKYLDLPTYETQGSPNVLSVQLQTKFQGPGLQSIFAILAALADDDIKMLLIDEPGLFLHPSLQRKLTELFYNVSKEKQIIITTHSNIFINRREFRSNYFVSRDKGQVSVSRAFSEAQLEGIGLADVKFVKSLIDAVPLIGSYLPTSFEVEKLYAEKQGERAATKIVQEKREEINITIFYEELKESIKHTKDELATRRRERVRQTNISYYVSLVCLIFSVLLIFTGVILIFIGKLDGGVLTTISSAITSIVSGLAFVFNKQINDLEREDTKELRALEKSYNAMGYISRITNEKKRDEYIGKLVENHFLGN